jgi:hypothetical protein
VIYSILTDREFPQEIPAIDGELFDMQDELFLMISGGQFLKNVVMPMLPGAYGNGATASNFIYQAIDDTAGKIINNGEINCGSVKEGLTHYHPKINALDISIQNNSLISKAAGKFDITGLAKAYVTFSMTTTNPMVYDPNTNNISFKADPNPKRNYKKHIPWWEYVVSIIGGAVILAIVDTVISLVTDSISKSVSNSIGSSGKNSISDNGSCIVEWNGLQHFQVKDAGLSTAFYMRGNYND